MKYLAIDHGKKNIGLAISDQGALFARPLMILKHMSLQADVIKIAELAGRENISKILVGVSFNDQGELSLAGRQAKNFSVALQEYTRIPVIFWDEAFSTKDAQKARRDQGIPRKKRTGHVDDLAAAILLQSYFDASVNSKEDE